VARWAQAEPAATIPRVNFFINREIHAECQQRVHRRQPTIRGGMVLQQVKFQHCPAEIRQRIDVKKSYARYVSIARAAALKGDAVETENCYQHAEHSLE